MNLPDGGRAVKGGRRRGLAAAPWGDPGEVGPLDYMFPTCAVHPVPLELRRLVEGISSGPDDSREHRREQDLVFSFFAAPYAMTYSNRWTTTRRALRKSNRIGRADGSNRPRLTCSITTSYVGELQEGVNGRGGAATARFEEASNGPRDGWIGVDAPNGGCENPHC